MNENRRNYYRILRVQPDATFAVIKSSYRTLLQKLRMHPDLGGDEWNASLINLAYDTLKNPQKRRQYDKELLEQYSIEELSGAHLRYRSDEKNSDNKEDNQRNYYRLLHVQNDSPHAIIESSFDILSKQAKTEEQKTLLKEAFSVLGNRERKSQYDALLKDYEHSQAVKKLNADEEAISEDVTGIKNENGSQDYNQTLSKSVQRERVSNTLRLKNAYNPLITQYCCFCQTPHQQSPSHHDAPLCVECNSPLFPPADDLVNQARRDLIRFKANEPVFFYRGWPDKQQRSVMNDISPTGICIETQSPMKSGEIIKIDGQEFKAVGETTYCRKENNGFFTGVQFLTVQFDKQKGQFFSNQI